MHPSLKRNAAAWHPAEHLAHGFRRRAQSLLQDNRARFIQHAVPARPIPQIQSDRQFLFEEILALLRRYSANLLHCRSPFYLCLEHVDNLGAYTASRPETGLLIPSDFANYAYRHRFFFESGCFFGEGVRPSAVLPNHDVAPVKWA